MGPRVYAHACTRVHTRGPYPYHVYERSQIRETVLRIRVLSCVRGSQIRVLATPVTVAPPLPGYEMPALRALSTPTDHVFDSGSGGGWSWLQEHLGSDYHVRWSAAGLRWTKKRHGSRPAGVRQGAGMHAFTHGYVCVAALSAHAFLHQRKWGAGERGSYA